MQTSALRPLLPIIFCTGCLLAFVEANPNSHSPPVTQVKVTMADGSKLSGRLLNTDSTQKIHIQSGNIKSPVALLKDRIISMRIEGKHLEPREINSITRVTLHPRFRSDITDVFYGKLLGLTGNTISLDSPYAGIISIKRPFVSEIQRLDYSLGIYYGFNRIEPWNQHPVGSWKLSHGTYSSQANGRIAKDVGLKDLAHIRFDTKFGKSPRLKLRLYADKISPDNPSAYYEININRAYAYLQTQGKIIKNNDRDNKGTRWRQIKGLRDQKSPRFDIYADKQKGVFLLYIDDQLECPLTSATPNPENLGTGISFLATDRYPIEISNITIKPWNGTPPPAKPQAKKTNLTAIIDKTGKKTAFRELKTSGDTISLIQADGSVSTIKSNQWDSIQAEHELAQPKKYLHDVKLHLRYGKTLTMRMASIKNGKIHGYHNATGLLKVNLSAVHRIDFNLYSE